MVACLGLRIAELALANPLILDRSARLAGLSGIGTGWRNQSEWGGGLRQNTHLQKSSIRNGLIVKGIWAITGGGNVLKSMWKE